MVVLALHSIQVIRVLFGINQVIKIETPSHLLQFLLLLIVVGMRSHLVKLILTGLDVVDVAHRTHRSHGAHGIHSVHVSEIAHVSHVVHPHVIVVVVIRVLVVLGPLASVLPFLEFESLLNQQILDLV